MDINKYKGKLRYITTLPALPKFRDDAECVAECKHLLDELFNTMLNENQDYGIRWMFGLDRYIKDKKKAIKRPFRANLDRGHIVEVELFGHFNKELTFLHPAVVLYDNHRGQLLVAPISSSKYGSSDSLHIDVDEADGLKHPSGVCLDSIRIIDKRRVAYQHKAEGNNCKLRSEKLNEIDEVILKNFLPITYQRMLKSEEILKNEIREHNILKEKYDNLRKEYDALKVGFKNDEVAASKED
ncbi:type II toxin-antitoxin system PemK/MazF family toxin [Ectobacillus antri]|uniref:type II toxin-antitoxin system PemK/MazF family toxin n=1 Tax=Ectobacillus antri TaxID=2486280 RepID=UPI001FE6C2EF|nr:type II toxin-antitoxin system PemK/MazF family toxin [Ectobacillus antri]